MAEGGLLDGLRVIEVSMFAPDMMGMHLADLGAEVIKVEAPGMGDPARLLGRPYRGASLASWRWNRGKRSVALDLRSAAGAEVFQELVASAEVVLEGMRPGALERRGLGYEDLVAVNPSLVFASISGWGQDGPYRDLGAHGLGFDAFAGLAEPRSYEGRPARPAGHTWHGIEAAPLYAAMAVMAGVLRARATGEPCRLDVAESDAAVMANMWRVALGATRAAAAATADDDGTPGAAHPDADTAELLDALVASAEGIEGAGGEDLPGIDVRYQYYATSDGSVLFMATETRFWRNFCAAVGRPDLFERWPGREPMDHDYGNDALRAELAAIFATRSRDEWVALFARHDIPGGPVHEGATVHLDPHFQDRDQWRHGPGQLRLPGSPIRVGGRYATAATDAPAVGQHSDDVLRSVLGYDDARIAARRAAGALGEVAP